MHAEKKRPATTRRCGCSWVERLRQRPPACVCADSVLAAAARPQEPVPATEAKVTGRTTLAILFIIAVMGACFMIFLALVECVASLCSKPHTTVPLMQPAPSLVLVPIDERRAQRVRFIGTERRLAHLAAVPRGEERRRA